MKRSDVPLADLLVAALAFHERRGETPDYALADRFPPKVILAAMALAVKQGYLECGVSLRTAWPTNKGRALLAGD